MNSRFCILLFAFLSTARATDLRMFEAVEPHMGTLFRIKLYAADEQQASAAFRAAFDRIGELDATLSDYKPESELNRICGTAVGHPDSVSEDLYRVLAASQKLAEETGGAFDVTLGPVIRLWREARTQPQITGLRGLAGSRRAMRISEAASEPGGSNGDARPGRACSSTWEESPRETPPIKRWRCSAGSVSAARWWRPAATWPSAIRRPASKAGRSASILCDRADANFTSVLYLRNAAVSTSGDTEQGADIGGVRYSHIIDPATGMGLTRRITVTIVAPRGIDADGMSTAVSVLGAERGMSFVEQHAPAAALVVTNGKTIQSRLWKKL